MKIRVVAPAYTLLIALWASSNRRIKRQTLSEFDRFLASAIRAPSQRNQKLPEEAIESIQRIESLLEDHQDSQNPELYDLTKRIVRDVRDLVTPILVREATCDAEVMACARVGLAAAATFANHVTGMVEVHSLLREVICCLAVMQQRIKGSLLPNEVIVLIRA